MISTRRYVYVAMVIIIQRDHMYGTSGGGKWRMSLGRLYEGGDGCMT